MPSTDTLSPERLLSVDQAAAETVNASLIAAPMFSDMQRSVEETLKQLQEKCERPDVEVESLCATVTSDGTVFHSEMKMSQAAAEAVFGLTPTRQVQRQAEKLELWHKKNQYVHERLKDDTRESFVTQARELSARLSQHALPDWMLPILALDEHEQSDAALDELFDCIDPMLSSGEYGKVDSIFAAISIEGPSLSLMMGLLSITRPAVEHLPSRQRFYERVYRLCKAMRRDAESLLGGLR